MNQRIHAGVAGPGAETHRVRPRPRLWGWLLSLTIAAALTSGLWLLVGSTDRAQAQEADPPGYSYYVQAGDSWGIIAELVGLPAQDLMDANPDAVRDGDILILGEALFVPVADASLIRRHEVSAGESWNSIADKYDIPSRLLRAVNPRPNRTSDFLYRGESLLIPPVGAAVPVAGGTPGPTAATATPVPTVTAAATPEAEPVTATVAVPAAEPEITATVEVTAGDEVTVGVEVTPGVEITTGVEVTTSVEITAAAEVSTTAVVTPSFDLPACPERFADYAPAMTDLINTVEPGIEATTAYLVQCKALVDDGAVVADLNGDGQDDLVVVYENPSDEQIFVEGDLAIFNSGPDGYTLAYRARAAGEVRLLATEDINADEQPDVAWVDTTCGASTCFDTINVRSWDGSAWADWTEGTITMAYAEIALAERLESGQGEELVLEGGIYGSVGAGPQRSRTEIWASVAGTPYALVEKSYSASECLYHTVLDANRAFLDAPENGFEAAQALYTRAATDDALIKCWVRNDELAELRSFSRFRLALIAGYQADADTAAAEIATLAEEFPDSVYDEVSQVWLEAYTADADAADAAAACAAVTAFAGENSAPWEILADYGYTNPSFEAADVCPVLELDATTGKGEDAASSSQPTTPSPAIAGLPACPVELSGYAEGFADALALVGPDQATLEAWLRACGALALDRGAVVLADINGDGVPDLLGFPTLITDLGYGPGGAQGAVFIFHSLAGGGYDLIADPPAYGQPAPLAVDDLNADGRIDVAWTVTGCANECLLRVEIYTWDTDAYVSLIDPGATLVNGVAIFTSVPDGAPGAGRQLLLTGGVSKLPEGGLAVPHTEVWQSVAGGLYRRIAWTYDDSSLGSDCLGLKLVEADVALRAADLLGYVPAIDAYTTALAPLWRACSIFGLPETDELMLLQGLASFRLVQAYALGGDVPAAFAAVDALRAGQPDSLYSRIALNWLADYNTGADATAACAAVRPLFAENPELWQITDHFGYNHPALGVDQICFVP